MRLGVKNMVRPTTIFAESPNRDRQLRHVLRTLLPHPAVTVVLFRKRHKSVRGPLTPGKANGGVNGRKGRIGRHPGLPLLADGDPSQPLPQV